MALEIVEIFMQGVLVVDIMSTAKEEGERLEDGVVSAYSGNVRGGAAKIADVLAALVEAVLKVVAHKMASKAIELAKGRLEGDEDLENWEKEVEEGRSRAVPMGDGGKVPKGVFQQPWEEKIDLEALRISRTKQGGPFHDAPTGLERRTPAEIRAWLKQNGFFFVKKAETTNANGTEYTAKSEIWYRIRDRKSVV